MARDRLRRALGIGALATAVAASIAVACGDPYSASSSDLPAEAGADVVASPEAAPPPPDPCMHTNNPAPPLVDDAPGEELPPFFVAVRTVSFTSTDTEVHGFDLDQVCTCDPRAATVRDGGASCKAKSPDVTCDQDGGVDNAFAMTAANLSPFFSLETVPTNLINQGRRTTLVQVGKYNGRLNDKEVAIGIALSDGIREQGCPTSKQNPNNGVWSPGWCANDAWSFLSDSVIPTTKQPLIQGVGYVSNGVLSFQLPGNLLLPFNEVSATAVSSPVFAGTVVPLGEDLKPRGWTRAPTELEKRLFSVERATIGGRIKATDALAALGTIEVPGDGGSTYVCQLPVFAALRTGICGATDIANTKALDFDPNAKCDSLSAGISFTAFPALPGEVRQGTATFNPCAPTSTGQPAEAGADPPYLCP